MTNNNGMTIAIIALVIIAGLTGLKMGVFDIFTAEPAPTGGTGEGDGGIITVETCPEDVSLKYNDYDIEDRSNDPASNFYMFNPDRGSIADDGAETMGTNVEFEGISGFASTTYYAKYVKDSTDCVDPQDFTVGLAKTGTLTVSAFNSDDDQPNSASDTQAVGASDEDLEMEICYDTVSNIYFGAPQAEGQSVLVIAYNKTVIDSVEIVDASRGNAPADYNRQTNMTAEEAWKIPNVVDGKKQCIMLNIDATSTEAGTEHTIDLYFYDANVDLDQSKYTPIYDIEDEDNNLLSIQKTNKTIYIA